MTVRHTLPAGFVTLLVADAEGAGRAAQRRDALLREAAERAGGAVFALDGLPFAAAFSTAPAALQAAIDGQRALAAEPWPSGTGTVRVRMAMHAGQLLARESRYDGPVPSRVRRLVSVGYGGQILVTAAVAAALAGEPLERTELRALGDVRLKDLGEAETVFQVVADGLLAEFPALASLDVHPNNLPAHLPAFVGRERELGELRDLLQREGWITIVAPGGMGKTRLALQAAADAAGAFEGGCWFVRLGQSGDAEFAATAIADALRIRGDAAVPIERSVLTALSERPALLVLDDAAKAEPAFARFARALREACPRLRVLATSRAPLGLPGECVLTVGALDRSVQLFYERAHAIRPELTIGEQAARGIEAICAKLHGVPLAIELAAAHVATAATAQAAAVPVKTLDALLAPGVDRQHAMRETLAWTYRLLDGRQRRFFARLGAFDGSFTAEAAAGIAAEDGAESARAVLDELTARALVTRYTLGGLIRYRLHHVVHDFAAARLRENEGETQPKKRLVAYERHLAAELGALLRRDESAAVARIAAERKNLHAALRACFDERGGDREAGRAIVLSLAHYWAETGRAAEGRMWIERALEAPDAPLDVRADLLYAAATMAQRTGDHLALAALAKLLVEMLERSGDAERLGKACHLAGNARYLLGEAAEAEGFYTRSLELYRATGNRLSEGIALMNLGAVALDLRGDVSAAAAYYAQSLEILQAAGVSINLGIVLLNLGELAAMRGECPEGIAYARNALGIFTQLQNAGLAALAHVHQAKYRAEMGEYAPALDELARARAGLTEQPNHRYYAHLFEVALRIAAELDAIPLAAAVAAFLDRYRARHHVPREPAEERYTAKARARLAAAGGSGTEEDPEDLLDRVLALGPQRAPGSAEKL